MNEYDLTKKGVIHDGCVENCKFLFKIIVKNVVLVGKVVKLQTNCQKKYVRNLFSLLKEFFMVLKYFL